MRFKAAFPDRDASMMHSSLSTRFLRRAFEKAAADWSVNKVDSIVSDSRLLDVLRPTAISTRHPDDREESMRERDRMLEG